MKVPHLFEFMDQPWLPESLAATLREILSCGNATPFRRYYPWVANEVVRLTQSEGYDNVVELGAGTAPVTRLLAKRRSMDGVRLIVCDARPDRATYEDLERAHPGKVFPRYDSVDFSRPQQWPPNTLLVLSGTFHHIPLPERAGVLRTLASSATGILIAEPLRKTLSSLCFVFLSTVPAMVLPLWYLQRPGKLRRFFWCWLCPVAPVMFWWDGIASCMRMWTRRHWQHNLRAVLPPNRHPRVEQCIFCQMVVG